MGYKMQFCPLLQRLGSPVRADGNATMSPDQSEGVFGALGWAGDRAKALAVPYYAGPVTERTIGLIPEQSEGMKPTKSLYEVPKVVYVSLKHIMEIDEGSKSPTLDKACCYDLPDWIDFPVFREVIKYGHSFGLKYPNNLPNLTLRQNVLTEKIKWDTTFPRCLLVALSELLSLCDNIEIFTLY